MSSSQQQSIYEYNLHINIKGKKHKKSSHIYTIHEFSLPYSSGMLQNGIRLVKIQFIIEFTRHINIFLIVYTK